MPTDELGPTTLKCDAQLIEQKYGPWAEIYAESRSAAAGMAGNKAGKEHWKRVAGKISVGTDR